MSAEQAREENAYAIGLQAFLWGYPLHYYGRTLPESVEVGGIYINDFRRFSQLKMAADKFVVTPNNVTIDAYAMLDLTAGPVVIVVPALHEQRWCIVQIGDAFDEVARNIGPETPVLDGSYRLPGQAATLARSAARRPKISFWLDILVDAVAARRIQRHPLWVAGTAVQPETRPSLGLVCRTCDKAA